MRCPSLALVLGLAALAGCKGEPKVEAGAPAELAAPAPVTSAAGFNNEEQLIWCVDYRFAASSGYSKEAAESAATAYAQSPDLVRLDRPCAEQFHERPVLASCAASERPSDGIVFSSRIYYYQVEDVIESDRAMRGCLARRGDWQLTITDRDYALNKRRFEGALNLRQLVGN